MEWLGIADTNITINSTASYFQQIVQLGKVSTVSNFVNTAIILQGVMELNQIHIVNIVETY